MVDEAETLAARIGQRVRAARSNRRWTLDELAERSGVSRRMLVNVEQGACNASIATLLRISDALGVGLPALVDPGQRSALVVRRAAEAAPRWRSPQGGSAVMVAGTEAPDVVELWDWTLGPGEAFHSETHRAGTRELLLVLKGKVVVRAGDLEEQLRVGDSATFRSDRPHAYLNPDPRRAARFALTVFEPGVGKEPKP